MSILIQAFGQDPDCSFTLCDDGTAIFGGKYNEEEIAKVLLEDGNPIANWVNPPNHRSGILAIGNVIHCEYGRIILRGVKDERVKSLFNKILLGRGFLESSSLTCECGADKCKLPIHSSWCPKH